MTLGVKDFWKINKITPISVFLSKAFFIFYNYYQWVLRTMTFSKTGRNIGEFIVIKAIKLTAEDPFKYLWHMR